MEPLLAEIKMFGGNFAPKGWFMCEGQTLSIQQFSALFSLLGVTYGGNGSTTFNLPDLRGRTVIHPGAGPGLPVYRQGDAAGRDSYTLSPNNIPPHTHGIDINAQIQVSDQNSNTEEAAGSYLSNTNGNLGYNTNPVPGLKLEGLSMSGQVQPNSGGTPINLMPPYLAINFIIAYQGVYPTRP